MPSSLPFQPPNTPHPPTTHKMSLSLRLAQRHFAYSLVHNRAAEDDAERIAAYATLRHSAVRTRPALLNAPAFKPDGAHDRPRPSLRPLESGSPLVSRARTEPPAARTHAPMPRPPLRAFHSHTGVLAPRAPVDVHPRPRVAALVRAVCADAAPVRLARQIRARCG